MTLFTLGTAENIVAALLAILSFTLFVISIAAYVRHRSARIAFVSTAFALFFCEGILFTYQLFYQSFASGVFYALIGLVSVAILLLIFAATFKR